MPLTVLLFAMLPLALPVLGGHKALGVLLKLAVNFRVRRQVLIETRMRCPKLRVVYQLWILRELLSYFRMQNGEKAYVYPCFDFTTLADSPNNAGVSWKYYGVSKGTPGYVWSPFDAIRHVRFGPQWTANVLDEDQFANDAATDNLAAVSWITTDVEESEHPGPDQRTMYRRELKRGVDQRGGAESCVEFEGHFSLVGRFRWFL